MVFIDFGFGKYLIWIGEYRNNYSIEYYTCCDTWGILKYLFFPIQRFSDSYRHLMWNQGLCLGVHHSFSFQSWWLEWFYVELIWVNCNYWTLNEMNLTWVTNCTRIVTTWWKDLSSYVNYTVSGICFMLSQWYK